jgi:hypothetical protein
MRSKGAQGAFSESGMQKVIGNWEFVLFDKGEVGKLPFTLILYVVLDFKDTA